MDFDQSTFGNTGQVGALGKELTDQPVSVFVGAALPGTVGLGEVDLQRVLCCELLMLRKLLAVVERQRLPQGGRGGAVQVGCRSPIPRRSSS